MENFVNRTAELGYIEENFVNRAVELRYVEETFASLLQSGILTRTPIYEFHGVGGIGKTWMLHKIARSCHEKHLPYIWVDASKNFPAIRREMLEQAEKYQIQVTQPHNGEDFLQLSIHLTRSLLRLSPVVILIDSLDTAGTEQFTSIEALLRDLVSDNRLFVVLASKKMIPFDGSRPIARKLVTRQLLPFDQDSCMHYLDKILDTADPEMRNTIFEWTGGYPLAVNAIVREMRDKGLDIKNEQDRKQLWELLIDQILMRGIFSDVVKPPSDLEWYRTLLGLLSIPRHSIIPIIQKLIEKFASQYAPSSSLAYWTLPRRINQATVVFAWNPSKAAYSIEASIRNIFMVKMKLEQPEIYYEIHEFLARSNRQQAEEVEGTDRVRYLQEYLYHSAHCKDTSDLPEIVRSVVQQIVTETKHLENFTQFFQDFLRDEELKASLGPHANIAISLMYKEYALLNWELAQHHSGEDLLFYLHDFFYYVVCDPLIGDLPLLLNQHIQQVRGTFSPEACFQLHDRIIRDDSIKSVLGTRIVLFSSLIGDDDAPKG